MILPTTRYYGSKRRLVNQIWDALERNGVHFDSILDLFGGSGAVSYFMATKGKSIIYNDIMAFNCQCAEALLCTPRHTFSEQDALNLLVERDEMDYKHIIEECYKDIYYTDNENHLIDVVIQNIPMLPVCKRASARYILFQSCLIKRPFNLFHRKNLSLRTNFKRGNFGNKTTWERSFEELFNRFTKELNEIQFKKLPSAKIVNAPALECTENADLVYIDTPYFSNNQSGDVPYHSRYHFLEGLMNYELIPFNIDWKKANREMTFGKNDQFEKRSNYVNELNELIYKYKESQIALSYTSSGYPTIETLVSIIRKHKRHVIVCNLGKHSFALNANNANREEVLIIGVD